MTLKELINNNTWDNIEKAFHELYPDESSNIKEYENAFGILKKMTPASSDYIIVLDTVLYEEEEEDFYSIEVVGILKDDIDEESGMNERYSIEMEPWANWLAMQIDEEVINGFSELDILGHCLFEMTLLGYTEEEIQQEVEVYNKVVEDFESLSEQEQLDRLLMLDEWISISDEEE